MANFNFYLNRQGGIGRQGVKGDKGEAGYSPYIDIKSNTPTEFIMTIHNETESFDTPNLIPTAIGEKVTEMDVVLTTHTEDIANLKLDITAIKNKDTAQDSDIAALKTRVGGTEESIEDLNHKYTVLGSEVSDLTLTKQNKLVEGANITLTDNADGTTTISASGGGGGGGSDVPIATTQVAGKVKPDGTTITVTEDGTISAVGGGGGTPANMVTTDTNQTVSGVKTFTNRVEIGISGLESRITTTNNNESGQRQDLSIVSSGDLTLSTGDVAFTDADGGIHVRQGKITDGSGNIVITQGNVTAGNNITITKTAKGIKIDGSGGGSGGATIDDTNTTTTTVWSSSKTNTEITTAVDTINSTKNDNIFDIGKFTVVGSPTITDDGVASGLDKKNYFKINKDIREFNKIILKGQYVWNGTNPTGTSFIYQLYNNSLNSYLRVYQKTDGVFSFYISQSGNSTYGFGNVLILPNIPVLFTLEITHSSARFIVMQNNIIINDIKQDVDIALSDKTHKAIIILGSFGNISDSPIQGSIDLKHFSITVDGKEVFNGLMESTKPIYDKIINTSTALSTFQTETDNNFSAVNSALNEKANLSDVALKQNILVSGTNIKTINGETILGEGNITVGGSTPANMVTTDTDQFITGTKSFYGSINLKGSETDNYYSMITNTGGSIKLQPQYGDPAGLNIQTNDVQFIDSRGISHSLLSQSKLNADEYYYKAGDVFTIENYAIVPAAFTNGKTQILMSIPMSKSMKNVSNISVSKCVLSVRVPSGGYLPSGNFNFLAEAGTTITTFKAMDNLLTLRIEKTGGWGTQIPNNVPLSVQISPADLIVEFN